MMLRGYSPNTVRIYVYWVRQLAGYWQKRPDLLSEEELLDFVRHLHAKDLSASSINTCVSAMIYLYGRVLKRPIEALQECLPRPRKPVRLPRAYSPKQVAELLEAARAHVLHYTFFSTLYHTGLRVREASMLRFGDIERGSNRILVLNGKGKKDRYTLLPKRLQEELVFYYKNYRAEYGTEVPWMFIGPRTPTEPFCPGTAHRAFHRFRRLAGLPSIGGVHVLRHSFATHHLMAGMDLVRLKYVMGHRNMTSTMRYLHLVQSQKAYDCSLSPLERQLPGEDPPES